MHKDRAKNNNEGCMKPMKSVDGEEEGEGEQEALWNHNKSSEKLLN